MNRKVKRISAIAVALVLLITGIHIEKGTQKTNAATAGGDICIGENGTSVEDGTL